MKKLEVRAHLACSPDRAFEALADHESFGGLPWLRCVLVKEGASDRNGLGAVRSIGDAGVTMLERVTAFEPGEYYEYQVIGGTLSLDQNGGRVELTPAGDGTDVVWMTEFGVPAPLIGGALTALAAPGIRFTLARLLASAKDRAEA